MGNNPTVSVVIPTYNRAHLISRTIRSVLGQTYQDFEVIIVDDGSTDNTGEVIRSFNDERLRYIRLEKNSGTAGVPRNRGIEAARGEFIALLDSDDEWLPEKLEKQIDKFKTVSPDVGVIYCGYVCVSETGEKLAEYMPNARGDVFRSAVEGSIRVGAHIAVIRKECFQKAGLFDTELLGSEEWEMWIRLAKFYKFDFVPEILAKYHVHGSQKGAILERQIQGYEKILRKYQDYLPKALVSERLRYIGTLYGYKGDFKQASQYFAEARRVNPWDVYAWVCFLLGKFSPRLLQAMLRRRYAKAGFVV